MITEQQRVMRDQALRIALVIAEGTDIPAEEIAQFSTERLRDFISFLYFWDEEEMKYIKREQELE